MNALRALYINHPVKADMACAAGVGAGSVALVPPSVPPMAGDVLIGATYGTITSALRAYSPGSALKHASWCATLCITLGLVFRSPEWKSTKDAIKNFAK